MSIPVCGGRNGAGYSTGIFLTQFIMSISAHQHDTGACLLFMIVIIFILTLVFALPLLALIVTLKFWVVRSTCSMVGMHPSRHVVLVLASIMKYIFIPTTYI